MRLLQADLYAKGLLALGLVGGVDGIAVLGCATFEAPAIFAAAAEIGVGFAVSLTSLIALVLKS